MNEYLDILNMDSCEFEYTPNNEAINQLEIGNMIRKQLNTNDFLEFVRFVEKPNKIKFTCKNEEFIFFGKVELLDGKGIIRTSEKYKIEKNAVDYKEVIDFLHYNKGKTQKQIAHRLDISQSTVSRILQMK